MSTAAELARLTAQLDAVDDADAMLQLIASRARHLITGSGFAALQCRRPCSWTVLAASDLASQRYGQLHATYNHKTSMGAPSHGNTGQSDSSALEVRAVHPDAQLARLGIAEIITAPIGNQRSVFGTFNWYLAADHGPDEVDVARWFARHASSSYLHARERRDLTTALGTRHRIGIAQGILMSRLDIDVVTAFTALRRTSQQSNTKLHQIAERVIATGSLAPDGAEGGATITISADPRSGVPAPGGRWRGSPTTDLDAVAAWLDATARNTMAARIEALQDFIYVLAAELDAEADRLCTEAGSSRVGIADGMSRSADYIRDAAIDVGNALHHR